MGNLLAWTSGQRARVAAGAADTNHGCVRSIANSGAEIQDGD
jgi:hypothetical protein